MSPQINLQSTGVEETLDEIEGILIRDVNDALEQVYARREAADQERALRRNIPYVPIEFDPVPPEHFHTGNFPSVALNEVPKESYPYIVLTIEDYAPDPSDAMDDHKNIYRDALVVHCLAQASNEEGSEVVFRRSVRMSEAVFISLASERTLQSRLFGLSNPVRGQQSIPWTALYEGHGEKWWFQASGTHYAMRSYTSFYQ